jgi:Domain of unknown function (DUF4169)
VTGDVVNLRRARKAKVRSLAEATAAENRSRFGKTKSTRTFEAATKVLDERRFEAHRREAVGCPEEMPEETDDR